MPLPFLLGAGAVAAGAVGIKNGIKGVADAKNANDILKYAENRHNDNIRRFEEDNERTTVRMDELGSLELEILNDFSEFSDLIEKIQNRPQFKEYNKDGVILPKYNGEELKSVSIGANVILGGLSGATVGTAGGYAAAGATTYAVMALGTASTGTAISSLSGAALTNATLAALGGGALHTSALAGGMALGSVVLGATTLGVGLLVGGSIFGATGKKLSAEAEEAYTQMEEAEKVINKSCRYLKDLEGMALTYYISLKQVYTQYIAYLREGKKIILEEKKLNWDCYDEREKLVFENLILLVGLLYKMCQINLVKKSSNGNSLNKINETEVNPLLDTANQILGEIRHIKEVRPDEGVGVRFQKAKALYNEERYEEAYPLYEEAANLGSGGSMLILGYMNIHGIGTEKSIEKAIKWWDKAVLTENDYAMYSIGSYFYSGEYIERNIDKAIECFKKAALRGNTDAMMNLCKIYADGDGVPRDYMQTFEWARRAAEKDKETAMRIVAACYHEGEGVKKNHKKAKEWLIKAAHSKDESVQEGARMDLKKWYKMVLE